MKKILLTVVAVLCFWGAVNAQQRTKLYDGVYIVNYGGGVYSIENDHTQQCISISIAQDYIDRANNQKVYKVVCNGVTKRVVKRGIKEAIKIGITYVGISGPAKDHIVDIASGAANVVYDGLCDSWGSSFE